MPVGNTPASIAAPYASEIISTFDIDKEDRLDVLFRAHGDQGLGYFDLLDSLKFKMPATQDKIEHDEEDWIHETFNTLNAVVAPGPGVNALITLDPTNLDSGNRFYPREWDTVMFPNEVTGQIIDIDITTPSAPVLTVRPNEVTDDIGALSAGQELIIISGAFSEGSKQPKGAVTGTFHYDNDLQIIKETLNATGSEMTNGKWFDKITVPDGTGTARIPAYYLKGQLDADYRMSLKMDGALLFQKRTTNPTTDPDTGRLNKTTEGLIPYIRRVGNTVNYTPGLFSVQRFNEIVKILDREHAPSYIMQLMGIDLNLEVEDTLVDYFNNTNISYTRENLTNQLFKGNKGLEASVGFSVFTKGQRTFALKQMSVFSHQKIYGASGYTTPGLGVLLPLTKKKDKLTKTDLPTIGVRHKQLGPYNRMMEVWNVSGAGPAANKVIEDDLHNHYMRAHIGAHHMGGNMMVLLNPS